MTEALQGVKVLVVEDEYLVATLMEDMLASAGCIVAGPIPRLALALDAASKEACDVAVLDVNLAGERVYPVADILAQRNVPFVFVTGYGVLPGEYANRPRLCKPFKMADLLNTLSDIVKTAPARH
ncbi:MAG: response regulator [Alphaproteobacteria bacterium]|nr:MAG: response regulator [Alphaproteobacteria bacterium]